MLALKTPEATFHNHKYHPPQAQLEANCAQIYFVSTVCTTKPAGAWLVAPWNASLISWKHLE